MVARIKVLTSSQTPEGAVVQGFIEVGNVTAAAFFIQPGYETAVWSLPDGELISNSEGLRGVLHLALTAAIGSVSNLAEVSKDEGSVLELIQQAWRLGLSHGYACRDIVDPEVAASTWEWLHTMVWPSQTQIPLRGA